MKPLPLLVGLFVAYTAIHVAYAAVWQPLQHDSILQIGGEMQPLQRHYLGLPVTSDNPRQYGPVFIMLLDPMMRWFAGPDPAHLEPERVTASGEPVASAGGHGLSRALYVFELCCLGISLACWLTLFRQWARERYALDAKDIGRMTFALVLLWLNFSPLLYILYVKNVEGWELAFLSLAAYASVRRRDAAAGLFVASAALIKMLPAFFFAFLLVRNRRSFVFACVSFVLLLGVSQWIYGGDLGFAYAARMIRATLGRTWALTWHENMSIKAMMIKALGHLRAPSAGASNLFDDPRTGYYVDIAADRLSLANVMGTAVQVIGVLWTLGALARTTIGGADPLWSWTFGLLMMMTLSPLISYEYTMLVLPTFSYVVALAFARPALRRDRVFIGCVLVALVLVANIVPRSLLVAPLPLARMAGAPHLKPTEAYQYLGLPLAGLLCLVVAMWRVRPGATRQM